MASGSTLPGPALSASRAALNSALNDTEFKASSPSTQPASSQQKSQPPADSNGANGVVSRDEEQEEGEIQELDLAAHAEDIRTVFSDPMNFNVKVSPLLNFTYYIPSSIKIQHPLYSSWTLWFDSPVTKGRNLPQTPSISTPATPLPQTPSFSNAAAQGWMEDIKRVINFDSVEEFWG